MKKGFNHFNAVIEQTRQSAQSLVEKATIDIAANAANDAPRDTGALAESYTAEFPEPLHGVAGSNMEYAPHVEYGTIHTAAQPHLVPAADRVEDSMRQYGKKMGIEIEGAARSGRA